MFLRPTVWTPAAVAAALVVSVVQGASGQAQTAEEAVAYLVAGMTDGATVGTSVFKRTGTSPATFATSRSKPTDHEPQVIIEIARKTNCVFDVSLNMDEGHGASKRVATLDFNKVRAMEYVGREHVQVTGADYCRGDIPPACNGQLAADVLPDTFKQAYADLRRSCP